MKHVSIALVATLAALVFGCQTPDVNSPAASADNISHGVVAKPAPVQGASLIDFNQKITYTNPEAADGAMKAVGNVVFLIAKVPTFSIIDDDMYDVMINVNGEISQASLGTPDPVTNPWTFAGSSKDRIHITPGNKVVFTKTFGVKGSSVPTILNMQFTITQETLAVGMISLTRVIVPSIGYAE